MQKTTLIFFIIVILMTGVTARLFAESIHEPKAGYVETDNPKLNAIRNDLKELKKELREEGKYECCISNDCNWCAIYMGHCPCANMVTQKGQEKSCPECAAAWNRKQGKIIGVDADAIKVTTFGIYGYEEGHYHGNSTDKTHSNEHMNEEADHHPVSAPESSSY